MYCCLERQNHKVLKFHRNNLSHCKVSAPPLLSASLQEVPHPKASKLNKRLRHLVRGNTVYCGFFFALLFFINKQFLLPSPIVNWSLLSTQSMYKFRDRCHILFLILSEFKRSNYLLFHLKSWENQKFSGDFRGNNSRELMWYQKRDLETTPKIIWVNPINT